MSAHDLASVRPPARMPDIWTFRHAAAVLLVLTTVQLTATSGQQCQDTNYKQFGSKTAYDFSGAAFDERPSSPPGCTPVQVYFVARHGTRYPGASDVYDMIHKVPRMRDAIVHSADMGQSTLCSRDIESLRKWKLEFNGSSTNLLAAQGRQELRLIAERLRKRFPSLFTTPYSSSAYRIRTTNTPRTEESAKAFASGFFSTDKGVEFDIVEKDDLLRFYKACSKWEKEVDDNDTALLQYYKFVHNKGLSDLGLLDSVTQRLGLNETLLFANISILYDMCRFDTAWNYRGSAPSPWCNVFSKKDLQILEYAEDLKNYWKDGYGHPLNYEQACPALQDLVNNFKEVAEYDASQPDKKRPPIGLFHFSHSGMLMKFYARLGLFKDKSPLLASDFYTQSNRKWKSSEIDPFAGNVAFVLFNCSSGGNAHELRVATYVQEKEIILQNCTSSLCPLDTFLATYGDTAEECNLAELCSANGSNGRIISFAVLIVSLLVVVRVAFL